MFEGHRILIKGRRKISHGPDCHKRNLVRQRPDFREDKIDRVGAYLGAC
jgi:hypothetical protein